MWRDLKYLLAYIIPAFVAHALYFKGIWSFNGFTIAFVIVPLVELVFTGDTKNLNDKEEDNQNSKWFFDLLLYLNVPMLLGLTAWYFYAIAYEPLALYETIGLTFTVGMYLGGLGINVAHELGHRSDKFAQFLAHILLIPNLYLHFFVEHNRGHHVNIATEKDPATSRLNEPIYTFYIRSVVFSYISGWELEAKRLRKAGKSWLNVGNAMIWYQLVQVAYLTTIGILLGPFYILMAIIVGILGFMMLETVNYIEHYGLQRRQLASGRYERVMPWHSWNCNHDVGRILLYELTRHSDHHYKATRKYQTLRHFEDTPMLPTGYPGSMILALFPPLWFKIMNPKVAHYRALAATQQVAE